jgi:hypothetical protein
MSKVVIIHPDIYRSKRDASLLESFSSDVIPIKYNDKMTKEELFTAIGDTGNITSVKQVAFLYHYPGFYRLPFFYDNIRAGLPERPTDLENAEEMEKYREQLKAYKPVTSKYTYWSDTVIDIIRELKDGRAEDLKSTEFIVDVLCCDLNNTKYKEEVLKIEEDLGINIRFSVDKTGNNASGGNWVMESESFIVNVQRDYFTDRVLEWKGVLAGDISGAIKAGTYSAFITWNAGTQTYTVVQDFIWGTPGAPGSNDIGDYIILGTGETFDGNGKTIDLGVITGWQGLFTSSSGSSNIPLIKNLGMLNGSLADNAGYIVRELQPFFKVQNSYSTGDITGNNSAGGIAGAYAGANSGSCTIINCYSTGDIIFAGGITGIGAGESGSCTITNCYSTGDISGASGGIADFYAGSYSGTCTITNCYSTGGIVGTDVGGITGSNAGTSGTCTITNCYSTGDISGSFSGGIAGDAAGSLSGTCTITNCYSSGILIGSPTNFGGITGFNAGFASGTCTLNNCVTNGLPYFSSGTATTNNCSQDLSVINGLLYGWPGAFWVSGDAVPTVSNYRLPILLPFQALPWIFTSSDPEYYNQATDPAQFYEEPPVPPIQMTIPPCCTVNICTKNPQETNYDNTNIANNLTGRAIANNVAEIQNSGNNGRIYSQPVFKTYYQYMMYLQSKHR